MCVYEHISSLLTYVLFPSLAKAEQKQLRKELLKANQFIKDTLSKSNNDKIGKALKDSTARVNVMKKRKGPALPRSPKAKKRKGPAPKTTYPSSDSDGEESTEGETEDNHYKVCPRTMADDDIIEILHHRGTLCTVKWADTEENPEPKIQLPFLWADYPHTVSKYRLKKKLVGKHRWWKNPTLELVEGLTDIISHKGNLNKKKLKECKFEVLCDNGYPMQDCEYKTLMDDAPALIQTYLKYTKK
jgi:hypothetical protein